RLTDSFLNNDDEIEEKIKKINFYELIERKFHFDEEVENIIWNVSVKFDSKEKYDAASIGYFLWTFAKALESIEGITVELDEWGEGSKWANLKIRIDKLSAKVDLKDILKQVRQQLEGVVYKKPLDEIQKIEAEKNKTLKETQMLPSKEEIDFNAAVDRELKLLQIKKEKAQIEDVKAETRLKNLEFLKGLSMLMKDGIQNNSSIQLMINELLYIKLDSGVLASETNNVDLIEANEVKERKEAHDQSE